METKKISVAWQTEKAVDADPAGAVTIAPLATQRFSARPQVFFRPDALVLIHNSSTTAPRLHAVQIADHVQSFDDPGEKSASFDGLPVVSLRRMPHRAMHVAEMIVVSITNPSVQDSIKVRPVLHGVMAAADREPLAPTFLPLHGLDVGDDPIRRFSIPHRSVVKEAFKGWLYQLSYVNKGATDKDAFPLSPGVFVNGAGEGCAEVSWRALWAGRITKVQIVSPGLHDLSLVDLHVGHRSQLVSGKSLPVELFHKPQRVSVGDMVRVAQDVRFLFENVSEPAEPRVVEINLEFEPHTDADQDAVILRMNANGDS